MQSHCQHNLYICHCSPSSQDPSPIHPLSTNTNSNHLQTTTLHRFPAKRNGNGNVVHESGNGQLKARPVYVSHSSVAVMTSPTLHITSTSSMANSKKGAQSVDLLNMQEPSVSPSTASSCSSLQGTMVSTKDSFLRELMEFCSPGNLTGPYLSCQESQLEVSEQ